MNVGDKWKGWTVESCLGRGTYGSVYKIVRTEFGHTYESALKVINIPQNNAEIATFRNEGMDDDSITTYYKGMVEDLVSEFIIMSELKGNSNIVSYEDHYYEENKDSFGWTIYIRMEMLTPLLKYMGENKFSVRDAVKLGIDMCRALELCQQFNIIHRDIKPENIFVSKFGDFKLGDFGIAKQLENATVSMSKKGTYSYMAPEVYKGDSYNSTVDTYSLGIVLYRLLNKNRLPFLPPYPEDIHYSDRQNANARRLSGEAMPLPCLAEGRLGEIVLKACSYDPEDRFDSPRAMREALESIAYKGDTRRVIYQHGDVVESEKSNTELCLDGEDEPTDSLRNAGDEELTAPWIDEEEDNPTAPWVDEEEDNPTAPWLDEEEDNPTDPWIDNIGTSAIDQEQIADEPVPAPSKPIPPKPSLSKSAIKKIVIGVIAAVIVFASGIGVYKYYNRPVPDVVGMDAKTAENTISEAGLSFSENREFSDSVERNIVIDQTNQGETLKRGTEISLTVSAGVPVSVPNLAGKKEKDAKEITEKLGLVMVVDGEELSDNIQKGKIISQTPDPKSECEVETEIKVIVSKGIVQVEVPDMIGMTSEKAQKKLKELGLKCEITEAYSSETAGNVIKQSVKAGKSIEKHKTVTLTISAGPEPQPQVNYNSGGSKKSKKKKSKSEAEWS